MEGFQSKVCLKRLCTIYLRCEATALSLVQDASCGWLCLRYSGSNSSLRPCVGVLGVFPLAQLGQVHAYKVAHATQRIIEEFATPTKMMPYSKRGRFLDLLNWKNRISKNENFFKPENSLMQICVRGFHHVRRCVWSALGGTFKAKELVGNLGGWNGLGGASKDPLQKGDPKNPSPNWSSHCRCSSRWAACSSCWSKIWVQGFLSAGTD